MDEWMNNIFWYIHLYSTVIPDTGMVLPVMALGCPRHFFFNAIFVEIKFYFFLCLESCSVWMDIIRFAFVIPFPLFKSWEAPFCLHLLSMDIWICMIYLLSNLAWNSFYLFKLILHIFGWIHSILNFVSQMPFQIN